MLEFLSLQVPVIGIALGVGGLLKLATRDVEIAYRSPLGALVSRDLIAPVWRAVGLLELGVASWVLVDSRRVALLAAAALLLATTAYVTWGRLSTPARPCGCFGRFSRDAISWRTVARSGLLFAAAAQAAVPDETWWHIRPRPLPLTLFLAEALAFVLLSPELVRLPRRGTEARLLACLDADMTMRSALRMLRHSAAWKSLVVYVTADTPAEDWRDGCWIFFTFPANFNGSKATAVFGLHVPPGKRVTGAIVDEERREVLISTQPASDSFARQLQLREVGATRARSPGDR